MVELNNSDFSPAKQSKRRFDGAKTAQNVSMAVHYCTTEGPRCGKQTHEAPGFSENGLKHIKSNQATESVEFAKTTTILHTQGSYVVCIESKGT